MTKSFDGRSTTADSRFPHASVWTSMFLGEDGSVGAREMGDDIGVILDIKLWKLALRSCCRNKLLVLRSVGIRFLTMDKSRSS